MKAGRISSCARFCKIAHAETTFLWRTHELRCLISVREHAKTATASPGRKSQRNTSYQLHIAPLTSVLADSDAVHERKGRLATASAGVYISLQDTLSTAKDIIPSPHTATIPIMVALDGPLDVFQAACSPYLPTMCVQGIADPSAQTLEIDWYEDSEGQTRLVVVQKNDFGVKVGNLIYFSNDTHGEFTEWDDSIWLPEYDNGLCTILRRKVDLNSSTYVRSLSTENTTIE